MNEEDSSQDSSEPGEDLVDEVSTGPGPAKLKSIPLSDEQKKDLKQAQARIKSGPVRPRAGMRVLFVLGQDMSFHDGIVEEVALSRNFVCLSGDSDGRPWKRWVERQQVLEELEANPH